MRFSRSLGRLQALALAAAALAAGCGPSIDPAAKADIDRRVALLTRPSENFAAPTATQPSPLAVGQWVQYKVVDDDGRPGFLMMKVVDELQGAYWIEYVTEAYTGRTVMKMQLYLGDRTNLGNIDVRAVKMKDAKGNVTEIPAETLSMMKSLWSNMLGMLVITWQGLPQEPASVPAGTFAGCYKARTDASWGPYKSASLSWSHPLVPLTGMVRNQGIDKPTTMELVAFGEKGGERSELP